MPSDYALIWNSHQYSNELWFSSFACYKVRNTVFLQIDAALI